MLKKIIVGLIFISAIPNSAKANSCNDLSKSIPDNARGILLCKSSYIVLWDQSVKIPKITIHDLTKHTGPCNKRSGSFKTDKELSGKINVSEYKKSGFDMGHMVPSDDFEQSISLMHETFQISNVAPQYHIFNAGIWLEAEKSIRGWAETREKIRIITGTIYGLNDIGKGINIPSGYYKIIIDQKQKELLVLGFVHQNVKEYGLYNKITSIESIKKYTGLNYNFSDYKISNTLWDGAKKQRICDLK